MRILLAEDDEVARRRLTGLLTEWGYEPLCVTTGPAALDALQDEDAPRLVLLDWLMPGADGLEVCRSVRALTGRPYTYIMLLTQKAARVDVIAGFEAGADDYLVKPVEPAELYARLRAGARVIEVQSELIRMREELRRQALYDPLTQILNRRGGLLALDSELGRAVRKSTPLAVAIVDLDHFKLVNDSYGHAAGDGVLRQVCKRMTSTLRTYDSLSRYGGEEFLIVLPECDVDLARRVLDRCRASIASTPVEIDGLAVEVTASFGAWAGRIAEDATAPRLIAAADGALYRAKRAGRDRVELVVPGGRPAAGSA
jgi:diguanylate cyclase (GGDEF)-like protein